MSEWQKVENPVGGGHPAPPKKEDRVSGGENAPGESSAVQAEMEYTPIAPRRPRKKRSDAGKKRAKPLPDTAAAETAPPGEGNNVPAEGERKASEPSSAEAAMSGVPSAVSEPDAVPSHMEARPAEENSAAALAQAKEVEPASTAAQAVPPSPVSSGPAEEKPAGGWKKTAVEAPRISEAAIRQSSSETGTQDGAPGLGVASPSLSSARYTRTGQRRGQRRWAAPLGLLVLLLAIVGVVALVITGINAIRKSQDDTALKEELYDFLLPVMQYNPTAFENPDDSRQDALILAAIWRITETERIRQLQEKDSASLYSIDDDGRMLVPLEEVNESYAVLFGKDAKPYHHTIGEEGMSFTFQYDPDEGYYHVPLISSTSMYTPLVDTLKKKGDTIDVRVGYVLTTKIGIDDKGKEIPPTAADADHFQIYTVQRVGENGWKLLAVADEGGSPATTTMVAVTTTTTGTATSGSTSTTAAATTAA